MKPSDLSLANLPHLTQKQRRTKTVREKLNKNLWCYIFCFCKNQQIAQIISKPLHLSEKTNWLWDSRVAFIFLLFLPRFQSYGANKN